MPIKKVGKKYVTKYGGKTTTSTTRKGDMASKKRLTGGRKPRK